jgi:transposase
MPKAKPLSVEQIRAAMNKTKSNRAAARYLNVSYQHYKKWAKIYDATEEGYPNLFEQHKNQSGKGIPKWLNNGKGDRSVLDIIEGRLDPSSWDPQKIKYRLFEEGYMKEECYSCGFHERRVSDYKIPLILNFKDRNKQHYRLDNLEMLCYNCYFLFMGDIFDDKQLEGLEDHKPMNQSEVDWELDPYQQQRLAELFGDDGEDDGLDIISRL